MAQTQRKFISPSCNSNNLSSPGLTWQFHGFRDPGSICLIALPFSVSSFYHVVQDRCSSACHRITSSASRKKKSGSWGNALSTKDRHDPALVRTLHFLSCLTGKPLSHGHTCLQQTSLGNKVSSSISKGHRENSLCYQEEPILSIPSWTWGDERLRLRSSHRATARGKV